MNLFNIDERHHPILIGGVIIMVSILLAPLLSGSLRESLIAPLLYIAWSLWLFISRLPHVIFWAIFLGAAVTLALRSLRADVQLQTDEKESPRRVPGRVAVLARWVNEQSYGAYFEKRLAQHLTDLTLQANGYYEPLSASHIHRLLEEGQLNLPPKANAYARESLKPTNRQRSRFDPVGWLQRFLAMPNLRPPDTTRLTPLIRHLEAKLEITHE